MPGEIPDGTAEGSVATPRYEPTEQTAHLSRQFGHLRDRVQMLNSTVEDRHRETQGFHLDQRAALKRRLGVPALVQILSQEYGMSWTDLARLVGVSVAAVRKWRSEKGASPQHRASLARLAAFIELLGEFPVHDPVGWLEIPLVDGYTLTGLDLYRAGKEMLLLEYAGGRKSAEQILDELDPAWRRRYSSKYEVFTAPDGDLALRLKTS